MKKKNVLKVPGFSLIEILVVLAIMGILLSFIVPSVMNRPDEAKILRAKNDINVLESALLLYKLDQGDFPSSTQGLQMLVEKNITLHSYCEHHFVPILGKAHVAYISNGHVIGLSKINPIVRHFAKRPQVQERLTEQIAKELKRVLKTDDVAVYIDAEHLCVSTRGIEDTGSSTVSAHYGGKFENLETRNEFLAYIGH